MLLLIYFSKSKTINEDKLNQSSSFLPIRLYQMLLVSHHLLSHQLPGKEFPYLKESGVSNFKKYYEQLSMTRHQGEAKILSRLSKVCEHTTIYMNLDGKLIPVFKKFRRRGGVSILTSYKRLSKLFLTVALY